MGVIVLVVIGYLVYKFMDGKKIAKCPHCNSLLILHSPGEYGCDRCEKGLYYDGSKTEKINKKVKKEVSCPYCNEQALIDGKGDWKCTNCHKTFIYKNKRRYKSDEIASFTNVNVVALLIMLARADGMLSEKEIRMIQQFIVDYITDNDIIINELEKLITKAKDYDIELDYQYSVDYIIGKFSRSFYINLMKESVKIASADGEVSEQQKEIIQACLEAFELSINDIGYTRDFRNVQKQMPNNEIYSSKSKMSYNELNKIDFKKAYEYAENVSIDDLFKRSIVYNAYVGIKSYGKKETVGHDVVLLIIGALYGPIGKMDSEKRKEVDKFLEAIDNGFGDWGVKLGAWVNENTKNAEEEMYFKKMYDVLFSKSDDVYLLLSKNTNIPLEDLLYDIYVAGADLSGYQSDYRNWMYI